MLVFNTKYDRIKCNVVFIHFHSVAYPSCHADSYYLSVQAHQISKIPNPIPGPVYPSYQDSPYIPSENNCSVPDPLSKFNDVESMQIGVEQNSKMLLSTATATTMDVVDSSVFAELSRSSPSNLMATARSMRKTVKKTYQETVFNESIEKPRTLKVFDSPVKPDPSYYDSIGVCKGLKKDFVPPHQELAPVYDPLSRKSCKHKVKSCNSINLLPSHHHHHSHCNSLGYRNTTFDPSGGPLLATPCGHRVACTRRKSATYAPHHHEKKKIKREDVKKTRKQVSLNNYELLSDLTGISSPESKELAVLY